MRPILVLLASVLLSGCFHAGLQKSSAVTGPKAVEPRPSPGFVIPEAYVSDLSISNTEDELDTLLQELDLEIDQLTVPEEEF